MQQVAQLVERPIEVVEYQQHSLECNRCGQTHTLLMAPNHRPWSRLGSELTSPTRARWATTDICPTRNFQVLLRELGDIDIGVGTLQATNARMAMAVEDSVKQLREWVKQQSSCTCRRIALASAGSERVAVGNNWAGVLREFAGESTLSRNTRPVSCWRHTVSC